MTRKLTALGLTLVAVLAMSAMMASAASAFEGTFKSSSGEYPVVLDGENNGVNSFVGLFGIKVECSEAKYAGSLAAAATSVTATPTYSGCTSGAKQATVTMNECDYVLHDATAAATGDLYTVKSDLSCPAGHLVELHIYNSKTPEEHKSTWCTLTVGAQANLTGLEVENTTGASPRDVDLKGEIGTVATQSHGECSAGATINFNSKLKTHVTIRGTKPAETFVGIEVD